MSLLERVAELERQIAELKMEVEVNYPMVKTESGGDCVLFVARNHGIRISGGPGEYFGYLSKSFNEDYTDRLFTGTITYKNGKPVSTEEEN